MIFLRQFYRYFLFISFLLSSCKEEKVEYKQVYELKTIKAKGKIINSDSILPPKEINNIKPIKVLAKPPKKVPFLSNRIKAEKPKKIKLRNVKSTEFDINLFKSTKFKKHDLIKETIALQPEVITAKDAYIKDRNPYSFSTFSKQQGLKHSDIRCLIQDSKSNIWMATDGGGVSKYDGKNFSHYSQDQGLIHNTIYSIIEDRHQNLWFATLGGGVCKFDGKKFSIYDQDNGLPENRIYTIFESKNGHIWIGTENTGLVEFDGENFYHYSQEIGLCGDKIRSIFEDKLGNIWIGTAENGVSKIEKNAITNYTTANGLTSNDIYSIKEDKSGSIWLGTDGGGINIINKDNIFIYTEKEGLIHNSIKSLHFDKNGCLWVGTLRGGVNKFDGEYFYQFTEEDGLSSNTIYTILEDDYTNIWFGTWGGGVCKYNGNIFTHFTEEQGFHNGIVYAIMEDTKGNLWFGTYDNGLIKFDGAYFYYYNTTNGLNHNMVRAIIEDSNGHLWIGTNGGGVAKFDGKAFYHYNTSNGLSNNRVWSILEDKNKNLWFGTLGEGVVKLEGNKITQFNEKSGLSSNSIRRLIQDKKDNIWICTKDGGITQYTGKNFIHYTTKQGLVTDRVWSALEDSYGNIWFGTDGSGVLMYNGKHFVNFTQKEGLSNNYIFSILEDRYNNIWFGTRFGVSSLLRKKLNQLEFNLKNDSSMTVLKNESLVMFRTYTYEDGFYGIGVNSGQTLFKDKKKVMWIGSNDRLTQHYPHRIKDTISPKIFLTSIDVFNEKIPWAEISENMDTSFVLGNGVKVGRFKFKDLSPWYSIPMDLSLNYNNNYLTFNFIGITMSQPHLVKYQYKLEGMDENWSSIVNRTNATYGNIPAGKYTFKVKAMNSEGIWSKEFIYKFEIRPPWWLTWWMFIFYAIFFIGIIILIVKLNGLSLKRRAEYLAKEVDKATTEIRKQKEEVEKEKIKTEEALKDLKNAQIQLIQSEKMASLGTLTAGVAHEINNPLNYIAGGCSGLEQILKERNINDDKINVLLNAIKIGVEKASQIIRGLNQFSKTTSNKKETENIHQIIDNSLAILKSQIPERIEITKSYYPEPIYINGNISDLHQMVVNIIINAVQAIPERGNIHISTNISQNKINIEFIDTGIGIIKENLAKITDPFFTTKEQGKGTGLGLSIAYNIIKDHEGIIDFESEVGKGTTVKVRLPISTNT